MYILKSVFLGVLLFIVLFPIDLNDIPRLSQQQVMDISTATSPECKKEVCG